MPARSRSAVEAVIESGTGPLPLGLAGEGAWQLIRFVVAGLGVTVLSTLVYYAATFRVDPLAANAISYMVGIAIGYTVHSRWSFRAAPGGGTGMVARFLIASCAAFALNSFWVWLATHAMHFPAWTPVPAMVFVTPLGSFALNRYWVFA